MMCVPMFLTVFNCILLNVLVRNAIIKMLNQLHNNFQCVIIRIVRRRILYLICCKVKGHSYATACTCSCETDKTITWYNHALITKNCPMLKSL